MRDSPFADRGFREALGELQQAVNYQNRGFFDQAEKAYSRIIKRNPDYFDALHLYGLFKLQRGSLNEALKLVTTATKINPRSANAFNSLGVILSELGRHADALASFDAALKLEPNNARVFCNRCNALNALGRYDDAIASSDRALQIDRNYSEVYVPRGAAFLSRKRYSEALESYEAAVKLNPKLAVAWAGRGNVFYALGKYDDALAAYDRALDLQPGLADPWLGRGNVFFEFKQYNKASAAYEKALALKPDFAEAWLGRGNVLFELKRYDDAVAAFERALALKRDLVGAWLGRGNVSFGFGRYDDALTAYEKALALRDDFAEAWLGRGNVLFETRKYNEALAAYARALALKADLAEAWLGYGNALNELKRYGEALSAFDRMLALRSQHRRGTIARLNLKLVMCDWTNLEAEAQRFLAGIGDRKLGVAVSDAGSGEGMTVAGSAAPALVARLTDDGAVLLASSIAWVREHGSYPKPFAQVRQPHDGKLRLGYMSQDFGHHVTGANFVEILEKHDRSRFDLVGLSLAADDGSAVRKRIMAAFDRFHDLSAIGDTEAAKRIHDLQVDILVEMVPHSQGSRPAISAHRPAPIQVNAWSMGYSAGSSCIDYILGDPWMLPFSDQPFFLEKIVHLPHTCFPHDSTQVISQHTPARSDEGLPETGFVFCCFNNSYKITPEFFSVWMRLLRDVSGSVLWLAHNNEFVVANLRREASARGIDPGRLVFAEKKPALADHLARHRLADLFLDTLPYNAQSTAMDALWAGLPVLTCAGRSYAGRFAMSQLHNIGLSELITDDLAAYERLALDLARDPQRLQAIRAKLERNRLTAPLFDTRRLCRELEAAYQTMADIWRRGEPPRSFSVASAAPAEPGH